MRFLIQIFLLASLLAGVDARAAGTAAGTAISNTATLDYSIGGVPLAPITSAPAVVTVDELIALTLTWQDGGPVAVNTPDANTPLSFALTNTGNGTESFTLSRNNALPGDQYNPVSSAVPIYVESNGTPGLQTGVGGDTAYAGSVTLPANSTNSSVLVYVLSDTPAGLTNGNLGDVQLTAASATPGASGAALGTVLNGVGDGGVDAMVGVPLAQASATGRYLVGGVSVTVSKTLVSPANPADLIPGATLTYRLVLTVAGSGTASGLLLSDPIPAELSYVAGSATLSGAASCAPCTDGADGDPITFAANTLSATLGNVPAPASFTLQFQTTLPQ
ncbi:MAG: hypothetical protein WBZ31_00730 [Thiobacillus sp.]